MKIFCLLTLGVIVSASPLAEATEPLLPPSAGTDAVLAMRSESAGELRLEYRQEAKGKPAQNISVGISDTYHYVDNGQGLTVHGYKVRSS